MPGFNSILELRRVNTTLKWPTPYYIIYKGKDITNAHLKFASKVQENVFFAEINQVNAHNHQKRLKLLGHLRFIHYLCTQ